MARQNLFRFFAILALGAAAYHLAAYIHPAFSSGGSPARHAVFVVLDVLCAWLLLKRPLWFVFAFAAAAVQVVWSHGTHAWHLLQNEERYDWLSIAVVLTVPVVFFFLAIDAWDRRRS